MKWRVIGPERRRGFMSLALEEACVERVGKGDVPPTLFFYEWEKPAVIVGHFQKIHDELNIDNCKLHDLDIIRRTTGGGAIYQDDQGGLTFGVIVPDQMVSKDINKTYQEICAGVVRGLSNLGIQSEFKPINDIIVNGKKISGSAQTRRSGAVLVHGTLLYDLDVKKMFTFLRASQEKISDKMIQSIEERVTSIRHHKAVTKEDVYAALIKGFLDGKDFSHDSWTTEELQRAEQLVKERYTNPEWVYRR